MQHTQVGANESGRGIMLAASAYLIWGVVPAYVVLMRGIDAVELIGWRILASLAVAALAVTIARGWPLIRAAIADRRVLVWLTLSGFAILVNWFIFAYGVLTGHIIETSLGYFLNPIVSIVLGVVVLRERLRPAQWVAVGITLVAIAVLIAGYGQFPWIAIGLAIPFAIYGLLKKQIGPKVDALTGFTIETATTLPFAVLMLVIPIGIQGATITTVSTGAQWAVAGFGIVTALPLMLFSAAARRISLVALGFLQYITPSLSFLFGAFVMGEPMPAARWVGFSLVWLALIVLTADLTIAERGRFRRRPRGEQPCP